MDVVSRDAFETQTTPATKQPIATTLVLMLLIVAFASAFNTSNGKCFAKVVEGLDKALEGLI